VTRAAAVREGSLLGLLPVAGGRSDSIGGFPAGKPLVIAIDGTSGSGKSTTARAVARALSGSYVDTGAMYRAVAWWILRQGVDLSDPEAIATAAGDAHVIVQPNPASFAVVCNGFDVTQQVREVAVTEAVSTVAAVPAVRAMLCSYQRTLADDALTAGRAMVMEGRDIGTVVLPEADVKIWLTADVEARAARRAGDGEGPVSETSARLVNRDQIDATRAVSPAQMAADAIHIDTTSTSVDEVVARVLELATTVRLADQR